MQNILGQIKKRRLKLGFKQHDMYDRIGISRQQYQKLESKGNPRLNTLELVAKGLNADLMLIPIDKVPAVLAVLKRGEAAEQDDTLMDPWQGLLGDDE